MSLRHFRCLCNVWCHIILFRNHDIVVGLCSKLVMRLLYNTKFIYEAVTSFWHPFRSNLGTSGCESSTLLLELSSICLLLGLIISWLLYYTYWCTLSFCIYAVIDLDLCLSRLHLLIHVRCIYIYIYIYIIQEHDSVRVFLL